MRLFSLVKKGTEVLKQRLKRIKCQAKLGNASGNACPREEVMPPFPYFFSSQQPLFPQGPEARHSQPGRSSGLRHEGTQQSLCWDFSKRMVA